MISALNKKIYSDSKPSDEAKSASIWTIDGTAKFELDKWRNISSIIWKKENVNFWIHVYASLNSMSTDRPMKLWPALLYQLTHSKLPSKGIPTEPEGFAILFFHQIPLWYKTTSKIITLVTAIEFSFIRTTLSGLYSISSPFANFNASFPLSELCALHILVRAG